MIITAVERSPRRRGHVQIYIDGVVAFELPRAAAPKHNLKPGRAIDTVEIDAMLAGETRRAALATAVAMLARRPRSEREIRRRLAQRKTDAAIIDQTIEKLRVAKLIDDAEFARIWTESRDRISPRGRRLVVQELRALGVESGVATDAATLIEDPDAAYRLASKRLRALSSLEYDAFRNRLGSYLQRRGFGWDVARATIDRCWHERTADAVNGHDGP